MKILLVCKGEYRYFFPAIARALKESRQCEIGALVFCTPAARMIERSGAFDLVSNLAAFLRSRSGSNLEESIGRLQLLESNRCLSPLNTMLAGDRILRNYSFEEAVRILDSLHAFWQHLLRSFSPDLILGEVASAAEWIGWSLAHKAGIPYLIPYPTPVPGRSFFLLSPDGVWESMERAFRDAQNQRLSAREEQEAHQFLCGFRARAAKPPSLAWTQRSPLVPDLARLCRRAARVSFRVRTYLEDGKFEVGSYHGTSPWRPIVEDTLRVARYTASESLIFSHKIPDTPAVFFPLHVQPEFTTDVRAPFLTNQLAVVEAVAKSVPMGWRVLVKEHPGMAGERRLSDYRDMKRLRNVILLSPSVDSHQLIRKCTVTATITGSAAWEAILYGKPAVALGALCYGFYDSVWNCEKLSDLPRILRAAGNSEPDPVRLIKFIHSFLASAHEFQWGDPVRMSEVCKQENCCGIARAILAEVGVKETAKCTPMMPAGAI